MAAAIGRVSAQAGSLGAQVQGLQRDSASLVGELKRVDSQARAAAETLEKYRGQVAAGGTLSEKEFTDVPMLKQFVVQRGGAVGQQYVDQFERELGGGPAARASQAQRPAAMAAPPRGVPMPDTGPRPLTPPERAAYLRDGQYTEEQLDRAKMLKPGTIMVPPAPRKPAAEVDEPPAPDEAVEPPGGAAAPPPNRPGPEPRQPRPEQPRPAADVEADSQRAGEARRRQLDRDSDALFRNEQRKRYQVLTERQLRYEWTETTRALRTQETELERTEMSYRKLDRLRQNRVGLSERETFALQTELP
ncbi:MAG: hypothetical protein ABI629_10465, partial [bacterium]